jgi:hypothetical protein
VERGTSYKSFGSSALDFHTRVLKENHDLPPAGHLGITEMFLCISLNVYWPGLLSKKALQVI